MAGIGAYIITLGQVPERADEARALGGALRAMGLFGTVELLDAIYWKDKAALRGFLTRYPRHWLREAWLVQCRVGQIACTFSHIAAWRRVLASGHDGAIIFEDDMQVTDEAGFREVVRELEQRPDIEFARLQLHKAFRDELAQFNPDGLLIEDRFDWGLAAYYVSRAGARKLIDASTGINHAVDFFPPNMRRRGELACSTVTRVTVNHPDFTGEQAELAGRVAFERQPTTLQKAASTIYSSPPLHHDAELHRFVSRFGNLEQLRRLGVTVLRGVFGKAEIEAARQTVLANRDLLRRTRPSPSSGHLAGFHRHPELEPVHAMLTGNAQIREFIAIALGGEQACTIGLSDITVNRSQQWHADLLRGKFSHHLDGLDIWNPAEGGVYKLLAYLNDSDSLKVVPGSHLIPLPLDSDAHAIPSPGTTVLPLPVLAGDAVILDIRCVHRGADEQAFLSGQWDKTPRILASTVFGGANRKLTRALEAGNFARFLEWQDRWGHSARMPAEAGGAH